MLGRTPGYITTQGEILADLFQKSGYEVTCVSTRINKLLRMADVIFTLLTRIKRFDVAIIDCFSGPSFLIADVASSICRAFGLPVIIFLRGGNFPSFIQKHGRWTRRVLKRATFLIAPSEFLAETFREKGLEVHIIPNVVDINNYRFRKRASIRPNLIWMRSFHEIYNPEMAVEVLKRLKVAKGNSTLVMAGPDKGKLDEVKMRVHDLGLSDSVRFEGFLDKVGKIREFSVADIYLNTNRIDNMPVSVIEARAFGLPVVSTSVGGLRYVIENEIDGLLVDDDDADGMAEAVLRLLNDKELTQKISGNGRQAAERCSWESVREEWMKVLEKIPLRHSSKQIILRAD